MRLLIICTFTILTCFSLETLASRSVFKRTFDLLHKIPPPPGSGGRSLVINSVIQQKVDNFDENNHSTWTMRYKENPEFFKPGGPIFIFFGGEWEISDGFITSGHFADMAKEHGGYLFYTEHRYYGKSFPTKNLSSENLKYLTVEQALADIAHFIKVQKEKPQFKDAKVVVAGGSYSATMVAWFRQQYPDLIVGGWSSSAPLFAKVDFIEYQEVVAESIKTVGGEACANRIKNGVAELEKMLENNQRMELKSLLSICDDFDFDNEYDVMSLFSSISEIGATIVQTHSNGLIDKSCKTVMEGKDDVDGLLKLVSSYLGDEDCNDFSYNAMLENVNYIELSSNIYRQWIFQTCNEFGWYQTTNSEKQLFGNTVQVSLYEKLCEDAYGIKKDQLYQNAIETNAKYGGWEHNTTHVYFTHGKLDPWNAMGEHYNEDKEHNLIPLYSHCKDFGSISETYDTEEMRKSKQKLSVLVRKWLNE